jgi:hypothetical protein
MLGSQDDYSGHVQYVQRWRHSDCNQCVKRGVMLTCLLVLLLLLLLLLQSRGGSACRVQQ